MAREILFRGKRMDSGEWYYGSYLYLNVPARDWAGKARGNPESVHYIIDEKDVNYAVGPETVGQFTGLTDKNGNRIFEGDIIKLSQSGKCYEVKYKSGCFCIGINWAISHEPDCEVIGNIHDNPELLNGTES